MPNHLQGQTSPYLLLHAENPVDWYPWSPQALERATQEDKPIFLSIGYTACHWCHVMEHESFQDPAIAALLNDDFISIKVDREERPDLDHIYMTAVQLLTGSGGWPMTVFLTPDLKPFYGGTYFPPRKSHGLPAFSEILRTINHLWRNERENLLRVSDRLLERLQDEASWQPGNNGEGELAVTTFNQALANLENGYDWIAGGWGGAPKFPQPMAIEFLLLEAERGNPSALRMASHALEAMQQGGLFDLVGGGFHRYATDSDWLIPHFEKMLTDNALLARAYLHAWLLTGNPAFRRTAERTIDFVLREMTHPQGGFYSSLDADSEGQEGKFYLWNLEELQSILKDPQDWQLFSNLISLPGSGNFEGKLILRFIQSEKTSPSSENRNLSRSQSSSVEIQPRLDDIFTQLLNARSNRIRPQTDDKILTAWNAFMLQTLAEAARYFQRPDYLACARKNAEFLLQNLFFAGQLHRSWRNGQAVIPGYLEDHASLVLALLELYQSDHDLRWYQSAKEIFQIMHREFADPQAGFYDTPASEKDLPVRPKALQDNATPSGNALAALASLIISALDDRGDLRTNTEAVLRAVAYPSGRYPLAFSAWLQALDYAISDHRQVAILYPPSASPEDFTRLLWSNYQPRLVSACSPHPVPPHSPEILQYRPLLQQLPTAYVCHGTSCLPPTTSTAQFIQQLASKMPSTSG